jgi:hypothetical protein
MGKKKLHKLVWKIKQIKTAKRMAVKKVIKSNAFYQFFFEILSFKSFWAKSKRGIMPLKVIKLGLMAPLLGVFTSCS